MTPTPLSPAQAGLGCLPGLFEALSGAGCVLEVPVVTAAGLQPPAPVLDSVMTTGGMAGRGMAEKDTWPASRWPWSDLAGASGLTYVSSSSSPRGSIDISLSSITTLQGETKPLLVLAQQSRCCLRI